MSYATTSDGKVLPDNYTGIAENRFGTVFHYKNGIIHRDDDEPAIIHENGSKYYLKCGRYHREDGPAIISLSAGGEYILRWHLDGQSYSKEVWFNLLTSEQKIKALWNSENW